MKTLRFLPFSLLFLPIASGGLLAHWKLDSTPADEVASFPATWGGAAAYSGSVAAPHSTAAGDFDGTNWLKAGTGIDFERNQAFSASAWIKGGEQDSAIVGDMTQGEGFQGWELHVGTTENGGTATGVTVWLINDYPAIAIQVNSPAVVLDGTWHHVAFTYDGSSTATGVKIYVDGAVAASTADIDTLGSSISNHEGAELNIGTRMSGAHHNFTGKIDEVAIFDNALAAAEMTTLFQAGVEAVSFPRITATQPAAGQSVAELTTADVTFSFPVSGVDAADLLVNGTAAVTCEALDAKRYHFTFPAPPQGDVHFTWAAEHGIAGLNGTPAQPEAWSCLFVPTLPPGQVIISEFLTKNAGGREDEDHDTPDWIEVTNPGTAAVNLASWGLTDTPGKPRRWIFPAVTLNPGSYLVVFASGKNRVNPAGTLHTDFKLADEGGYLALSDPTGALVHVYDGYPRQEGNVSFGLLAGGMPADGRAGWRYLSPTPAAVQSGVVFSGASITEMNFSPAAPVAGDAITVTIRTSPESNPVPAPKLYYKVMHDLEYSLSFADDGLHGDGAAGDRVWGATIPAGATAGQMVRWRASLMSNSILSRWPVNTNATLPLPVYEGTVIGGNTAGQVLPVYQIFVPGYVIPTTTNQTGADSDSGARGAFFGYGKFYDNVLIRIKGTTSRYLLKRSHRVDFNPGHDFEWSSKFPAQRELNLNSEYIDPSYLRQNHELLMHRDSGNSGAQHFPVRTLINGENWQLAFHTYSADSELIETMGLDPRGALYKQVGTLSGGAGEQKTRRWDTSRSDINALAGGISSNASIANRSLYMYDNLNLPAVINYLAVTRIAQEADDVWANMVVYRDTEGTGEWQPIPFDLNLSFGQLFYGGVSDNTTVHADHDNNKSHPLYGSSACQPTIYSGNGYNRLYNTIIQDPVTRAMLLRRIRSLMDRYLTTSAATSPLEANFDAMGALIRTDADIDRARWGLPPTTSGFNAYGLGPGISPAQGLATLKTSFLAVRRTHFYVTHSINNTAKTLGIGNNNKAGIPDEQIAAPVVNFGTIEANPVSGNQDQEFIQLTNPGTVAVDVSDWVVRGGSGAFKLKGGTVIPAGGSLYVSPNVVAFRARTVTPKKAENRYVVGPYSGHLSIYGETLKLENATGGLVAQAVVPVDPSAPAVHLAVTEIMPASQHADAAINGDWWELTNTGAAGVELSGFSWDDNHLQSGQAVFPAVTLPAGESAIILDESDASNAAAFREVWHLPASVKIFTREDFGMAGFPGLGSADSVAVYLPDGSQIARADYTSQISGKSRAWFRNGIAIPGGSSLVQKYGAAASGSTPGDIGSPGFAAADPATFTAPYDIWAAANDLWLPANISPAADPDGDGRNNRTEYAFGGSPRTADQAAPQTIASAGNDFEWTYSRRSNDPALVFTVQSSADLDVWTTLVPLESSQTPDPQLAGFVKVTCRVAKDETSKFLRVRAE